MLYVITNIFSLNLQFLNSSVIYQLLVIRTHSNRELTVSDNNLHIKPTTAISFTVCLLL